MKFEKHDIVFDLNVQQFGEEFTPIPERRVFRVNREELKKSIKETELTLAKFAHRIQAINQSENLNLERIEDLLVWENMNYL